MFLRLVLANPIHFLCETSTWTLALQRHVIWRDSVGVGVLGQGLDQSVRVISQQSLSVCYAILMSYNNGETGSCLWLQSRSVLDSFGVVSMSCKINFHVVRSAL